MSKEYSRQELVALVELYVDEKKLSVVGIVKEIRNYFPGGLKEANRFVNDCLLNLSSGGNENAKYLIAHNKEQTKAVAPLVARLLNCK